MARHFFLAALLAGLAGARAAGADPRVGPPPASDPGALLGSTPPPAHRIIKGPAAGHDTAAPPAAEKKPVPLGSDDPRHTYERAGYHYGDVSKIARPSNTPEFCGYYVGGGCPFHGGPPGPLEGTFGWDYCCHKLFCPRVQLGWCHRYKGGTGDYRTEGPYVPNIFAFPPKEGHTHEEHSHGGEHHGEGHP
jgi:hypothetical protein